jgi:hypothetical protein
VAAALNFQRILEIVIEDIVGWSLKNKRSYRRGGLFGVPKAWLRVVEEQSRLTLHTHMLIWLYGHSAIENQLDEALKRDEQQHEIDLQSNNINSDDVSDFLIIKTHQPLTVHLQQFARYKTTNQTAMINAQQHQ